MIKKTWNGKIIDQIIPAHNSSEKVFMALDTAPFSNPISSETKTENCRSPQSNKRKRNLLSHRRTNNDSIKKSFICSWKQFSMLDNKHIKLSSSLLYHHSILLISGNEEVLFGGGTKKNSSSSSRRGRFEK